MKCPFCQEMENKVIDSRMTKEGLEIRRRRECLGCEKRFTTYERIEEINPMVVKKDGRREPFDKAKIISGIKKACEKRPISMETMEKLVDDIEHKLQESEAKEISGEKLGEIVMEALRELDEVAYVRFASVYRSFRDINEFMSELQGLLKEDIKKVKKDK
ncbi:MAG: transcriptional repressor NrdR [Proteobacteria bacterium]|nr:transcriptional repressor NrdR [Pseudomonadota bacterium]